MNSLLKFLALFFLTICSSISHAQSFNLQDTLRGSITPERAWWDLTFYHLDISVDPENRFIQGTNLVQYRKLASQKRMQIDLQAPMKATRFTQDGMELPFEQLGNVYFISLPELVKGDVYEMLIEYEGYPPVSSNPPWSGGVTWNRDGQGNHFIATSCQGDGASMWWPCKDHMYDEPDSMLISVTVPEHLMDVSNGRLRSVEARQPGTKTYHWSVANPINNYGVNVNIGKYVHFGEVYAGERGDLTCDYYVLESNLEKAKKQFSQVPMMLEAFEYWFGPYPFYEDGFKLVEVPYLGMEHQSSVTYGNGYENGYLGNDRSESGWGLKFDFIIIHEAGHEWFANSITYRDIADMWIHEGFTAYSEALYLEYHYGREAGDAYNIGKRWRIRNDRPIIGTYDVNHSGSGDMYVKGANMLHTLRNWIDDDQRWRKMLRGLNESFYHQTVTTGQIERYMSKVLGKDLKPFFDQYLRDTRIPVLEYRVRENTLWHRWSNTVSDFDMPVDVSVNGTPLTIYPTPAKWQRLAVKDRISSFSVNHHDYIGLMEHRMQE